MNIYCVIFMCTFGANNTDTEMPLNNSLIDGPNSPSGIKNISDVDVASMILPERGEPVPQIGDIVMELPKIQNEDDISSGASILTEQKENGTVTAISNSPIRSPTLSDILLPPSAPIRNQVESK